MANVKPKTAKHAKHQIKDLNDTIDLVRFYSAQINKEKEAIEKEINDLNMRLNSMQRMIGSQLVNMDNLEGMVKMLSQIVSPKELDEWKKKLNA